MTTPVHHRTTARRKTARRTTAFGVVVATAVVLAVTTHAFAADKPLRDKLSQLDERSQKIEDLTANFTEQKFTVMLKKPLVSKGRVKVMGSRTRWDTTEPHATTLFTDDKQIALYFPSRKTAEIYSINHRLRPLIVSPVPRLATLERHFHIEQVGDTPSAEFLRLRLTPKDDALAEFIDEVHVDVNLSTGVAHRFELIDPDDDRTVIEFTDIRINVALTDEDVAWNFPPNTRIVRPLDSTGIRHPTALGTDPQ